MSTSSEFTRHIIKTIIHEYWVTKTKEEVNFHKLAFPVYTQLEKEIFVTPPLIGDEFKEI